MGCELRAQLLHLGVDEIVGLDTNESDPFFLEEEHRDRPGVRFYLGDIQDLDTLARHMEHVDVVLHSAASKHVHLTERAPRYAVQTNILGVQNVIDAALSAGVERVVFTSSDKAVNPTSVMGTSKLMGERLLTAADALHRGPHPIFASVRFGDVPGSRGSVIPVFRRQIAARGPVTLTDPGLTRFIMSIERLWLDDFMHEVVGLDRWAGQRMLEVGCGLGTDALQFARGGARYFGVDLTQAGASLARRRLRQQGHSGPTAVADAERLPCDDDTYDLVDIVGRYPPYPEPGGRCSGAGSGV